MVPRLPLSFIVSCLMYRVGAAGGAVCDIPRVDSALLQSLPAERRSRMMRWPVIVSGAMDAWPAMRLWSDPVAFADRHGDHRLGAWRTAFGISQARALDHNASAHSVRLRDLIDRADKEHVIVLDETEGTVDVEDALLRAVRADYSPPEVLANFTHVDVLSVGGHHFGVRMMQHDVAWLGLVAGAKLWSLAPPDAPRPAELACGDETLRGGSPSHAIVCTQRPGEIMFVPSMWWHATCNLAAHTVGVGGQMRRVGQTGPSMTRDLEASAGPTGGFPSRRPNLRATAPLPMAPRAAPTWPQHPGSYIEEGCDLWKLDSDHVTREMLDTAPRPFIITGGTTDWSATTDWQRDRILRDHGDAVFLLHDTHNRTLRSLLQTSGQYHMGHLLFPRRACYSDPYRPYTPFLMRELRGSYRVAPRFRPMSTFQMGIGTGTGIGVPPEQHPRSWFAMVVGRKRWILHPGEEPRPDEMMNRRADSDRTSVCDLRSGVRKSGSTLECTQQPGEIIWVPGWWWHETCGIDDYSVGLGGITFPGCCEGDPEGGNMECGSFPGNYEVMDIPYCRASNQSCPGMGDFDTAI